MGTLVVCGFLILTQDIQIFPGVLQGAFLSGSRNPSTLPSGVQSVIIQTEDSETLELWITHAGDNTPVALFFHGNAETIESSFHVQRWLSSLGFTTVAYDYRGYGLSSGWPSDAGLKNDIKAVVQYLQREGLTDRPLHLVSSSIGTALAAYTAPLVNPQSILLLSPYTSLRELVSELPVFGFLHRFVWYDLSVITPLLETPKTCVLLAVGGLDTTIPPEHARRIQNELEHRHEIRLLEFEEAGHNDLLAKGHAAIAEAIRGCLS